MERIDRLTTPAKVGRLYLVPVVMAEYHKAFSSWPVIGPEHDDTEFFKFALSHYHIDTRFLTRAQIKLLPGDYRFQGALTRRKLAAAHATPLTGRPRAVGLDRDELPNPEFKPLTMRRQAMTPHPFFEIDAVNLPIFEAHFAGAQCTKGKSGWICPHRHAPLGSMPVVNGVITCPLHSLRIDAATGRVLPPRKAAA